MAHRRRTNRKRWLPVLEAISSSYWFVPSLMAVAAVTLAFTCIRLDAELVEDTTLSWLYSGGAAGARSVLVAVTGSMITVAGVVFSITIVAMSLASQQFGPMLLRNFIEDRRNQVVLGTFVATFVFGVIVLRSVRAGDDAFVPHLSTTLAIAMSIASLGVLIFFIHHVARSIRVDEIVARVAGDLDSAAAHLLPDDGGEPGEPPDLDELERRPAAEVTADDEGYLLAMDDRMLLECARDADVVVEISVRCHDFVVEGTTLFRVRPREQCDPDLVDSLRTALVLGTDRSTSQDMRYGLDQLVQLALRALSPSLNDPLTAKDVIDRVTSFIAGIVRRGVPDGLRFDGDGKLRVIARPISLAELVERGLDPIRRGAATNVMATSHLLASVAKIGPSIQGPEDRETLHSFVRRVEATARDEMPARDWASVEPILSDVLARIARAPHP